MTFPGILAKERAPTPLLIIAVKKFHVTLELINITLAFPVMG